MNTITRPRKRSRVKSTNWRTFAWLVTREAALRITYPHLTEGVHERAARAWAMRWRTDGILRVCGSLLKFHPGRRFYYGP
jgi:hypothetical protein